MKPTACLPLLLGLSWFTLACDGDHDDRVGDGAGAAGAGGDTGSPSGTLSSSGYGDGGAATSSTGGAGTTGGTGGGASGLGGSGGDRLLGDEWFASDLDSAGDAPSYGFDSVGFSRGSGDADMTVTRQLDSSLNRPVIRQDIHSSLGEFGGNWFASPVFLPSQCSWGDSFFLRFSFMPIAGLQQEQKIVILSRGDIPNSGRFIVTIEDWGRGYAWRLQKDGGDDLAQFPDVSGDAFLSDVDTWSHLQIEGRYSSGPGVADGHYRLWVNNDDQTSPDAERMDIVLETTAGEPNFLGWSGYHQQLSGPRSFAWTDVRVGPSFDPGWAL